MLTYLIDYSLEELIKRYNDTAGNKTFKQFMTLPTERDGTIQVAFIILFTVDEVPPASTATTAPKTMRVIGGDIIPV